LTAPTWVVVVGQPTAHTRETTPAIIATAKWLSENLRGPLLAADTPHRLLTICSGTLLAARAGLLSRRRCTTHHELLPALRMLAPQAQVIDNRVIVVDGPLASSAGITAGIDLALHLIAEECGEALAASVGADMVVYLRRSPRDPELSPFHMHRRHLHTTVHRVQDAIIRGRARLICRPSRRSGIPRSAICFGCSSSTRACLRCTTCARFASNAPGRPSNSERALRERLRWPGSGRACSFAARGIANGAVHHAMQRGRPLQLRPFRHPRTGRPTRSAFHTGPKRAEQLWYEYLALVPGRRG
jgi:hypothetical protein